MSKITRQDLEEKFGKPCIEIIPEAALPNPQDPPPLPDSDAEQIINCFQNAIEKIQAHTPNVPPSDIFRRWGITLRNNPFIISAIEYAQEFPDTIPTNLSITTWLQNLKSANTFILLYRMIVGNNSVMFNRRNIDDSLVSLCHYAMRVFAVRTFENFQTYYKFNQAMANLGSNDSQVIYERLKPYFARARHQMNIEEEEIFSQPIDVIQNLVKESNQQIDKLLHKEKELQREINENVKHQDEILDKMNK